MAIHNFIKIKSFINYLIYLILAILYLKYLKIYKKSFSNQNNCFVNQFVFNNV
jgi:hypothetical protein